MGGGALRVLICDERLLVTEALTTMLGNEPGFEIVGVADSGVHAMILLNEKRPDVVIVGLHLRAGSGIDLIRRLRATPDGPPVVLYGADDSDELLAEALRAGADGVLADDADSAQLIFAVRAVVKGDAMLGPSVARRLLDWFRAVGAAPDEAHPMPADTLTSREREVIGLAAQGLSAEEIAGRLTIGVATVRTHLYRARTKLGLPDRAALVSYAYRAGLMHDSGIRAHQDGITGYIGSTMPDRKAKETS